MLKLNQIIAIEKGEKSRHQKVVTEIHRQSKVPDLFNGFVKEFRSLDEDGERIPEERKTVQFTVAENFREAIDSWKSVLNTIASKDFGNTEAKGDIQIDDSLIAKNVPPTFLLTLEKELNDIETFVRLLPELDNADDWDFDVDSGLYKTAEYETHRTKKIPKVIVKYDATKDHPAQTEMINEDKIVGYWKTKKLSGAIPTTEKKQILARITTLRRAVKFAREEANSIEIAKVTIADAIVDYVFGN